MINPKFDNVQSSLWETYFPMETNQYLLVLLQMRRLVVQNIFHNHCNGVIPRDNLDKWE